MDEKKENKPEAVVEIIGSGPLRITGNFILKDLKRDTEWDPGEIFLCRCGKSNNKPFCDESHKTK
jgi:CDGSH-type Zn-finger protein